MGDRSDYARKVKDLAESPLQEHSHLARYKRLKAAGKKCTAIVVRMHVTTLHARAELLIGVLTTERRVQDLFAVCKKAAYVRTVSEFAFVARSGTWRVVRGLHVVYVHEASALVAA